MKSVIEGSVNSRNSFKQKVSGEKHSYKLQMELPIESAIESAI